VLGVVYGSECLRIDLEYWRLLFVVVVVCWRRMWRMRRQWELIPNSVVVVVVV